MFKSNLNNLFGLELTYNSRYQELKHYIRYISEHDEADVDDLRVIYDDLLDLATITLNYIVEKKEIQD